jgi:dTDP-4-amino-4,6-dideoxygalactose transaminase
MTATIPQTDPRAEYLACREEIDSAIRRVLEGGHYVLGSEVAQFENEFASYLGAGFAIGVNSGTDALTLALRACDVGAGDEVITASHTAVATVVAIERCEARPVLVDVDPATFTLAPEALAEAVSPRTKAIVPVHLYGQPADMAAILRFARERGLHVIEDCAQAHGAACRLETESSWRKVGTLGTAAAFSFYPTKNLGAIGDGGCVVTGDPDLAERVRLLRQYGWRERYVSGISGWNSRLDEMQAAILRVKLRNLEVWNDARRTIAATYGSVLAGSPVTLPMRAADRTHVFHQYVVRLRERDRVRAAMTAAGIGTAIHYPVPVHRQPAYEALAVDSRLGTTEPLCSEILSLPMHPHLSLDAAEKVATQLLRAANEAV